MKSKLTRRQNELLALCRSHPMSNLEFETHWIGRNAYLWLAYCGSHREFIHIRTAEALAKKGYLRKIDARCFRLVRAEKEKGQ